MRYLLSLCRYETPAKPPFIVHTPHIITIRTPQKLENLEPERSTNHVVIKLYRSSRYERLVSTPKSVSKGSLRKVSMKKKGLKTENGMREAGLSLFEV